MVCLLPITSHGQDARTTGMGLTPRVKSYHPFRPVAINAAGGGELADDLEVAAVSGISGGGGRDFGMSRGGL